MSELKISENVFLGFNELKRWSKFINENSISVLKNIVTTRGIVRNEDNSNFKISLKPNTTNTIIINSGLAFDSNLNAIVLDENLELVVIDSGVKKWVVLERNVTNKEIGKVSINQSGLLTGIGTKFKESLRGQNTDFPTRVNLNSVNNPEDYEVVLVESDTSAILAGEFVEEVDLKYSVVGCFSPGFIYNEDNKFIYEFDSCSIFSITSESIPDVNENQFILGSLEYINGILTIEDYRYDYMFNDSSSSFGQNQNISNPLVSLLQVKRIGDQTLEMFIEHGYTINSFSISNGSAYTQITIVSGGCNFLSDTIPDNLFKDWILLNRKNMKHCTVIGNANKILQVSSINSSFIEESDNDLVVIPNFNDIEIEIKFSGEETRRPIYQKFSIENIFNRINFPITYGTSEITVKYRLINSSLKTPYQSFAIAPFVNLQNINEILANSNFSVTINQPIEVTRNYS